MRQNVVVLDSFAEMCEMPETLQLLLDVFDSMAWSRVSESSLLSLPNFPWSSRFLQNVWNFLNHLLTVLRLHLSHNKYFWLLPQRYDQVRTRKGPELDNTERSSMQLSNHTRYKAIHNVSAHQLAWYYQTTGCTYHSLNYFGHALYTLQTSTY